MSDYYKAKRSRNLYEPGGGKPYKLSRSKLELFMNCPRCFYLDRRLGIGQPPGFPFNLNSAVDALLKKEFDGYRARQEPHPLMTANGIDAVPFAHDSLDEWRENFKGVTTHHEETNLVISGAVDDLWVNPGGEVIIVDYKATSKNGSIGLDAAWQDGYKRQMEIYQWLVRRQGLPVSDTGYFVYCNGRRDRPSFEGRLEFDIHLLPYTGNAGWVEGCIRSAYDCLNADTIPGPGSGCDFCSYRAATREVE
jgi:hypothetical protein